MQRRYLGGLAALGRLLAASCRAWFGRRARPEYREKYVVVDDAFIDNCIAKRDAYCVVEPLLHDIDIEDEQAYYKGLSRLSVEQKYLYAIFLYDMEMGNGGWHQFYTNYTGIVWEEVLVGLREIGATEHYELMRESVRRMGGNPSKDRDERYDQIEQLESADPDYSIFGDLENQFDDIRRTGALSDATLAYVKKNREKFYFDGVLTVVDWTSAPTENDELHIL